MEKINFHLMQLIEETAQFGERFIPPDLQYFDDVPPNFEITIDKFYYEVTFEKTAQYIWLDVAFGSPDPRDDELTNIKDGTKKNNPRDISEAELLKQLFCLYDFSKEILYLSNLQKKSFIETIFKEKTGRDFIIKPFYKSKDEFIDLLKSVNEISFTEARNLFDMNSRQRQALIDLSGTDSPENFTITASYSKGQKLYNFINILHNGRVNGSIRDLVIRGLDRDKFEIVFNNDTFSRKIEISSQKDNNGKHLPDSIKNYLLQELSLC